MSLPIFNENAPKPKPQSPLDNIKHVVAIAAGKGGVGKSTITVNLALALNHLGYKVGILDSDLYGPSIRKMLPEDRPPGQKDDILIPAICQGISVISMAYFRHASEATIVRAPIANNVIQQFLHKVAWGPLDFLLIDFPPGTGDIQLTLSQQASLTGAIIVTTPQQVAILDVQKAMNMFDQLHLPILGIIENMSGYYHPKTQERICIFGSGGGVKLAEDSGNQFLGEIPIDPEICRAGDEGKPLIPKDEQPGTPSAKAFLAVANQFIKEITAIEQESPATLRNFELTWKEM